MFVVLTSVVVKYQLMRKVLFSILACLLLSKVPPNFYEGRHRQIHWCFERVNHLLSLLVPVSDINRIAVGTVRRQICQLHAHGEFYIPLTLLSNTRDAKYIQNEWFKQRIRYLDRDRRGQL